MPVLPSGHGSVYPAPVSRVPGSEGHAASDAAKLSLSRYSDLGHQGYRGRKIGPNTSEVSGVAGEQDEVF